MEAILTRERIAKLKSGALMPEYLQHLRERAEEELGKPQPQLTYAAFKLFGETGDRDTFQKPYFEERARISLFSVMLLLTDEERWKSALEDAIYAVCGDVSWVLPAHFRSGTESENDPDLEIDLFAAETGFQLSEVLDLLGDRLDARIVSFADRAIRQRVIEPFLEKEMFWETRETNWAAVCGAGTLASILYRGTETEAAQAIPRICRALDCFKKSYSADGCCIEGTSYWNYGFGFYVYIADLLKKYTKGETDLLSDEKSQKMAAFFQNVLLGDSFTVSFGDSDEHTKGMYGLASYLHRHAGTAAVPALRLGYPNEEARTVQFFRDLAWYEPAETASEKTPMVYYSEYQWYIRNTAFCSLAVNGGRNWGPHQHLGVGNFILIVDDKAVFADFGAPQYTRQYFSGGRYSTFCASSRGHNVPIIDGKYQLPGKEHGAEVLEVSENTFSFSFEKAYGDAAPEKLVRRFDVLDDALVLTDVYSFKNPMEYTERFVTNHKPVITDNGIQIAGCTASYDSARFDVKVSTEEYAAHDGEMKTAYCIDFTPKADADTFVLTVKRSASV